jgi:hypothetical protein
MASRFALAPFVLLAMAATGCSLGQGIGEVKSDALFARDCWGTPPTPSDPTHAVGAPYSLQPDFFAAVPYRSTLEIRVQRGTDLTEVSDGLRVNVDDIDRIRAGIQTGMADGGTSDAGADGGAPAGTVNWRIGIAIGCAGAPGGCTPPPDIIANPPIVHMSLYLQRSCHNQNTVLEAVDGHIAFTALFDGNPNETSAAEKFTAATFDAQFGDVHDAPFDAYAGDIPAGLQTRVTGSFSFYFERGQPAQPFP